MSAHQSTQWFWSDWAGDQEVRRLTPAERGLWIDLLALAAVGKPYGYVCDQRGNPVSYEEIARFANCTPTEAESLVAGILFKGAASRDRSGRLFNRRMTRQAEKTAKKRTAGKLGAEQTKQAWKSLKALELELSARAPATADATAPLPAPILPLRDITIVDAGASAFTPGSKALASALWKALGYDTVLSIPIELSGCDWRAIQWEKAGWTVDLIDAVGRRVGPGKPLSYYEKSFANEYAKRQAPLPIVEIKPAEKLTVTHGKTDPRSLTASIRRELAELQSEGADFALPVGSLRLISN